MGLILPELETNTVYYNSTEQSRALESKQGSQAANKQPFAPPFTDTPIESLCVTWPPRCKQCGHAPCLLTVSSGLFIRELNLHLDFSTAALSSSQHQPGGRTFSKNGSPSLWNGSPSLQNGSPSRQNSSPSFQNGSPLLQNGSPSLQNSPSSLPSGSPSLHNGSNPNPNPPFIIYTMDT